MADRRCYATVRLRTQRPRPRDCGRHSCGQRHGRRGLWRSHSPLLTSRWRSRLRGLNDTFESRSPEILECHGRHEAKNLRGGQRAPPRLWVRFRRQTCGRRRGAVTAEGDPQRSSGRASSCKRLCHNHHSFTDLCSITSSARSRNDLGIASPSVLAVLRLMTISNFAGNCTGRSPGFAPRRMRSTANREPVHSGRRCNRPPAPASEES
jgi:hypothetical protein